MVKLLCFRDHYKEYLVQLINRNDLDVVSLLEEPQLRLLFDKNGIQQPDVPANVNIATFLRKVGPILVYP